MYIDNIILHVYLAIFIPDISHRVLLSKTTELSLH